MVFDMVHKTQETYRKILSCMSRPGTISTLLGDQQNPMPCHDATFLTIVTLLDAEVSFHVVSDSHHLREAIADYTLAKETAVEQADFVIVPKGTSEEDMVQVMKQCKIGTLENPQHSSTWIIEQDTISVTGKVALSGPGIKMQNTLHLDFSERFLAMRNERVKEFPLGADLIFTDPISLACIPRTTTLSIQGGVI